MGIRGGNRIHFSEEDSVARGRSDLTTVGIPDCPGKRAIAVVADSVQAGDRCYRATRLLSLE